MRFLPPSVLLNAPSSGSCLTVVRYCGASGSRSDYSDEVVVPETLSWAYGVLELKPHCSSSEIKAAFRSKVKQFHPDLNRDRKQSDIMVRHVIQAYEILSNYTKSEIIERECIDPFDQPECEAFDVFVNQALCLGPGCPYPCVATAPHAFSFCSETETAQATFKGSRRYDGEEEEEGYRIQVAASQCPKKCIHFVTPLQRMILEELLQSILIKPYDTSAEADLLYSLIVKAGYANNRYQWPKGKGKGQDHWS